MVATPSASLSQHAEPPFSKQIQKTLDLIVAVSKRLEEIAANYHRVATSISKQFRNLELDTYHSTQNSLRLATIPMATTEVTLSSTASQHRTSWERPEPSPTTKSATTTPEVAIGEFPSNSEKVGEVITSRITPTMGFFAILGFSLGCVYLVANTPEEVVAITIQICTIIGGVKAMYEVSTFMLDGQ